MAKENYTHSSEKVDAYLQELDPKFAAIIEALRKLILSADKEIGEHIKWNSPAFFYSGTMKPFDPKEYKRDLVVINIRKGLALLVFPTGAGIRKNTALLEGDYKDGRRMITFRTAEEVKQKGKALQDIIKEWLSLVEK